MFFKFIKITILSILTFSCAQAKDNNFNKINAFNTFYDADLILVPTNNPIKKQQIYMEDQNNKTSSVTLVADKTGRLIEHIHNLTSSSYIKIGLNYDTNEFYHFDPIGFGYLNINGKLTLDVYGNISSFKVDDTKNEVFSKKLEYENGKLKSVITIINDWKIEKNLIWQDNLVINYSEIKTENGKTKFEEYTQFIYDDLGRLTKSIGYINFYSLKYADIIQTFSDYNNHNDWMLGTYEISKPQQNGKIETTILHRDIEYYN